MGSKRDRMKIALIKKYRSEKELDRLPEDFEPTRFSYTLGEDELNKVLSDIFPWGMPMPEDDYSIWEAQIAWQKYYNSKGSDIRGAIALEKAAAAQLPIPAALLSSVERICKEWLEIKGNRQRARSVRTVDKWEVAVQQVEQARVFGVDIDTALDNVAARLMQVAPETHKSELHARSSLKRKYDSSEYADCRNQARTMWEYSKVAAESLNNADWSFIK